MLRNGENVGTCKTSELNRQALIKAMTGNSRLYDREYNEVPTSDDNQPVLVFEGVSNDLIKNISFKAYKGEIVGFAGLEGSHKSEISSVAFGLSPNYKGKITFKGKDLRSKHPIQSIRLGIGLVPTDRKNAGLITCRSVADNIILSAINRFKMIFISPVWARAVVSSSIKRLSIKTSGPNQLVEYLSGGNQQKVMLSKWLDAEVDLLFLVEPTEGIDVGARADLYKIFRELAAAGKTLVIFSSDIDEVLALSDRIYAMVKGRIVDHYYVRSVDKLTVLTAILSTQPSIER